MRSLFAVALCVACSSSGTWTKGKRGVASFAYRASPDCGGGCNLEDNAVASDGAHQILAVTGAAFASVASSDPTVATFNKSGDDVEAVTAMAGDTDLSLLDAGGMEIDRVTVHVAATAMFDFKQGWSSSAPILLAGQPLTTAPITKRDAGVRVLLGTSAIRFSVSGTLTSLGAPPADPNVPASVIESFIVQGTAGSGTIHAVNGSQSLDVPVTVINIADVTKLTADVLGSILGSGGATVDEQVTWRATSAGGLVYGAACAWTVSDPSVGMGDLLLPAQLDREATGSVTFKMSQPGSFMATCTLGPFSISVPLKRES